MPDQDEHLAALKAAADADRVAVALDLRAGRGRRYFCPFCQPEGGKTADLSVQDKGFHCFKCGRHGDLLDLVQTAGGMSFPDAVRFMEDQTGIRPSGRRRKGLGSTIPGGPKTPPGPFCEAEKTVPDATAAAPDTTAVYEAFLAACRPDEGHALEWLTVDRHVAPDVVERVRLRVCGKEYLDVIDDLVVRFGNDALLTAGLLKRSKAGKLVPSFWHYYARKEDFLVIPYLKAGKAVYLKVRPPCGKATAESKGLVRFMNTAAAVPYLYNVDALAADPRPDKVLVCEGESDTWSALSAGYAAVGSPGARNFKAAWVEGFRPFQTAVIDEERAAILEVDGGLSRADADAAATVDHRSAVYLVMDADAAGKAGQRLVAGLFRKAGLPVPLALALPPGQDLTEFLKEGMTE